MEDKTLAVLEKFAEGLKKDLSKADAIVESTEPGMFGELPMASVLKPKKIGVAEVDIIEINEFQAGMQNLRAAINKQPAMGLRPGKYARLSVRGILMMTDTPHEVRTCGRIMKHAHGDVLIAGLGLGMILIPVLRNPLVTSVRVVEKYLDVIKLIWPQITKQLTPAEQGKLTLVSEDIFTYKTKDKFDCLWFDIWPDISTANLKEMAILHRRFAHNRKKTETSWMDSWMKDTLVRMKRNDNDSRRHRASARQARRLESTEPNPASSDGAA